MTMDSLYEKYVHERERALTLKYDQGFVVYKFVEKECFIVNMFIVKEARGSGLFKQMLDDLSALAKRHGCEVLTANIHLSDKGANHSLRSALNYGFKVVETGVSVLLIGKSLKE